MIHWTRTRALRSALVIGLFLAGPALAATTENMLVTKIAATKTLKLEDGITVKVQSSTQILNEKGERITFEELPDPELVQGQILLRVEGPSISGAIQATKVKVHEVLRY